MSIVKNVLNQFPLNLLHVDLLFRIKKHPANKWTSIRFWLRVRGLQQRVPYSVATA